MLDGRPQLCLTAWMLQELFSLGSPKDVNSLVKAATVATYKMLMRVKSNTSYISSFPHKFKTVG